MSTNFDNGLEVYGAPLLPDVSGDAGLAAWVGTIYFASSSNGSNSNDGLSQDNPKATIQAALNLTTADKNDIVFVENATYTEDLTMTKADVTLIGQSRHGVKVVGATNATDTLIITGANCRVSNMSFDAFDNGSDISDIYVNNVDNCVINNCYFEQGEYQIEVNSADYTQVLNCLFDEPADTTDGAAVYFLDSNQCKVAGCTFALASASDAIIHEDADDLEVAFNQGLGADDETASAGVFINVTGADTSSRVIVHDNNVSLFGSIITFNKAGSVAVCGLGAADLAAATTDSSIQILGNESFGNTIAFDVAA